MNEYSMYNHLKSAKLNDWHLKKKTIPAGVPIRMYVPDLAKMIHDFPCPKPTRIVVLQENDLVWMSDDPYVEQPTNAPAIKTAFGDVLECGLGVGLFSYYASLNKKVKSITVVERQPEVIDIVGKQLPQIKEFINSDCRGYLENTDRKFDFIHIDIWPDLTTPHGHIEEVTELAKQRLNPNGIVSCWLQQLHERIKNKIQGARTSTGFGVFPPCVICGKTLRNDYGGLCMDCSDCLGISELFINQES
jgi:hypothetical protein